MSRVLLLIKGLGRGGAEQLLAGAARHADRSRFDYEVAYLLPWKDALVKELHDEGVGVHCLDGAGGIGWVLRLRRLVDRRGITLVHSHSPVAAVGARMALDGTRVRHIYTEHNVWERYHRATYWSNMLTFTRSDHVFAVSEHVRDSIRYPTWLRRRHLPPIETLFHGIDPAAVEGWTRVDGVRKELGISDDAPVIGAVANLKAHKRLDRLIQAMPEIRDRVPGVRLVLVGQGPMEDELRALSRRLQLGETVLFTGFREDAPRIASCFDVFALSSEQEGLSIALIEALALGKPAVVTRVGGLAEVVEDGRQGFVVSADDPAALTDPLVTLLQDEGLRLRMGGEARERARDFDIRKAVRRIEQVYEELLA